MQALSKKYQMILNRAYTIREAATHSYHKVGCVIFDKAILSIGFNHGKTHPKLPGFVDKLHAEMAAIKYANCDVNGATIVVVRGKPDKPLLAKPCLMCMDKIKEAGIKKVIYSTPDGYEVLKV